MMNNEKIDRINTLYHKSKSVGLTPEEAEEQKILRREFVEAFKANLRGQLDNIDVKQPDGSVVNLGEKHAKYTGKKLS